MPFFRYSARNAKGELQHGILEAVNDSALAAILIRQSLSPITIESFEEEQDVLKQIKTFFKFGYPSLSDLAFFSRQMYSLTRAGIPMVRALKVVKDSAKNAQLKTALDNIVESIESGQALATSMRKHPDVFPTLMVALVSVGENTGKLAAIFEQLTTHFEREIETRKRIQAAMRYPITVIVVLILALGVINVFVIPAFAKFFEQFNAKLPWPTLVIVTVSNFTVNYWYVLLMIIVGLVMLFSMYINSEKGHRTWDEKKLKFPIIGSILKRTLLARFVRTFALCIRSGLPLLESVDLTAKSTDNMFVMEQILSMRSSIEHGETITRAATTSGLFTPLVLQMFAIGEETGEIDRLLDEVSSYYEREVDYEVKRLGDSIEPILIVLLGGIILVVALGVYLPMWDLSKAAFGKN
jgi:MSHA biogenesis protein MshG